MVSKFLNGKKKGTDFVGGEIIEQEVTPRTHPAIRVVFVQLVGARKIRKFSEDVWAHIQKLEQKEYVVYSVARSITQALQCHHPQGIKALPVRPRMVPPTH